MQNDFNMVLVSKDERLLAVLAHGAIVFSLFLGPLCALVPAFLWFREHQKSIGASRFLTFHAAQATIYQAIGVTSLFAAAFVTFLLCFIFIGLLLVPVVIVVATCLYGYAVFVAVKVYQGENMKYFLVGEELARRIP